jgi:hypothetical protein
MSESTLVRDPRLVSIVDKLKTGKIETEIGYKEVAIVILLGIKVYNNCEGIQKSKKYENLKNYLSHTMAVAITIPVTLLIMKVATNEGGIFSMIYAIMGLAGASIALDIMRQPSCKESVKPSDKTFTTMSVVAWLILLLGGGYFTFKKYPKLGEALKRDL